MIHSKCGKFIYHICIIDYLVKFDNYKKLEILYKRVAQNAKVSELSAMDPIAYQQRFWKFFKY